MEKLVKRFLDKTEPITESGCWIWLGKTLKNRCGISYGGFYLNGKSVLSHRFSYKLFVGEIPHGMFVCHRCDTPLCVRPDHLFIGTQKENITDMIKKGRRSKHPSNMPKS